MIVFAFFYVDEENFFCVAHARVKVILSDDRELYKKKRIVIRLKIENVMMILFQF